MPFKSQAQRGFLFANHPAVAKEFSAATPKGISLPVHVGTAGAPRMNVWGKMAHGASLPGAGVGASAGNGMHAGLGGLKPRTSF